MKKGIIPVLFMLLALDLFSVQTEAAGGRADPSFEVDVHNTAKACRGTTILADNHNRERPRIVELNMEGEIVWRLNLKGVNFRSRKEAPALGFYKAQRIIRE